MWVFIFGSTEQSSVHGTVYGLQHPMTSHSHFDNDMHQQHQRQRYQHQSSASAITSSAVSVPVSPQSPKLQEKQETTSLQNMKTASAPVQSTPKAAVAKDEVKALHTCKWSSNADETIPFLTTNLYILVDRANPNDPNELSFEKDELIEILDRRGNWWQAKKHNGAIGIVPSNYVCHICSYIMYHPYLWLIIQYSSLHKLSSLLLLYNARERNLTANVISPFLYIPFPVAIIIITLVLSKSSYILYKLLSNTLCFSDWDQHYSTFEISQDAFLISICCTLGSAALVA